MTVNIVVLGMWRHGPDSPQAERGADWGCISEHAVAASSNFIMKTLPNEYPGAGSKTLLPLLSA